MGRHCYVLLLCFLAASGLFAQERIADSLHRNCEFEAAKAIYDSLLVNTTDSLVQDEIRAKLLCSENALAMSSFVYKPSVVARHRFSLSDFFLYYPLQDKSWVPNPSVLDSVPDTYANSVYAREDADKIFFSKSGKSGSRNLYFTEKKDSLWSVPSLINESLTSSMNEVYPLLSSDGKRLYFSSDGLYGVGGYDLYVSEWNEETSDWDAPVNMGFPFSSPYDDFLYMDTPDGRYSIFASNRECSSDSVYVYVLDFDNVPVGTSVEDPAELRKVLSLNPTDNHDRVDNGLSVAGDIPENEETRRYMEQIEKVRSLRDSINRFSANLDEYRQNFALSTDDDERAELTESIMAGELRLPELNRMLEEATAELQKTEMDFLFKGVVIDTDLLLAKADRKVVGHSAAYTFTRMNQSDGLKMEFEEPEIRFDYSFRILESGLYAENQSLPQGVIYQIHFITLPTPATIKQLKGLSPVYESVQANGNYMYRVGLFNRYSDALEHLNDVKSLGFRSASVLAYIDGKQVKLSQAREYEENRVFWKLIINTGSDTIPAQILDIIRSYCNKDISKTWSDGITFYVVSAFDNKYEAEELEALIRDAGFESVSVSEIQ